MIQLSSQATPVHVGAVLVDRHARRLWRGEQPLALGGQSFELLLALVARPGHTVARAELLASAWPGRVVEHNTLEVHVAALRKVLGPDSIVTVRGRGYRLVAPVWTGTETAHAAEPLGRGPLLEQAEQQLAAPGPRLLTLLGPGGSGKTLLAVTLAKRLHERMEDGAQILKLDGLPDATALPQALLQLLALQGPDPRPTVPRLVEALVDSQRLLVLDGAEPWRQAVADVLQPLLSACRRLCVLVTSRLPLGLPDEQLLAVPPLELPLDGDDDMQALQAPALALLVQRAARRGHNLLPGSPDFAAARQVCQQLQGLPLALELAAARLPLMSARELLARLARPLSVLVSDDTGLEPRHRSLRQTIASGVSLLDANAQALLARLSVLVGGANLDSATAVHHGQEVAALQGLDKLIEQGLVTRQVTKAGASRFTMHDTVREYAAEQLQAMGETAATRRHLVEHLTRWLDDADAGLRSAARLHWIDALRDEGSNLHAVLNRWVIETPDAQLALELVARLGWWWYFSGQLQEGRRWQDAALALPGPPASAARARVHVGAARLALYLGAFDQAIEHGQTAVQMARAVGSRSVQAEALYQLAIPLQVRSREEALRTMAESVALYDTMGDRWGHALALSYGGIPLALAPGREAQARQQLQAGRQAFVELGDDWGLSTAGHYLGIVALREGRLPEARAFAMEVRSAAEALGDSFRVAGIEHQMARIEEAAGRPDEALAHTVVSAGLHLRHGRSSHARALLQLAAALQARQGHQDAALTLHAAATQGPPLPVGAALTAEEQAACAAALEPLLAQPAAQQGQAWARGSTMTLRQAVAFARSELPEVGPR